MRVADLLEEGSPTSSELEIAVRPNTDEMFIVDGDRLYSFVEGMHEARLVYENAAAGQGIRYLTVLDSCVVFSMHDGSYGAELWRSDGQLGGTVLLADVWPGPEGAVPQELTSHQGAVYFTALDSNGYRTLWRGDCAGEVMEVVPPATLQFAREVEIVATMGALLFFRTDHGGNDSVLWRTDGTSGETVVLGSIGAYNRLHEWVLFQERLYFLVNGLHLWRTDGTPSGTVPVEGVRATRLLAADDRRLYAVDLARLFSLDRLDVSTELANIGTEFLPMSSLATVSAFLDGALYVHVSGNSSVPARLWRTEGAAEGTQVLSEFDAGAEFESPVPVAFKGRVYFSATDGELGRELWKTDGTPEGTTLVEDIYPGLSGPLSRPNSARPQEFTTFRDSLYFVADDGQNGTEPRVLSRPGVTLLSNLRSDNAGSCPRSFMPLGEHVLVVGNTVDGFPLNLWSSDGTAAGSVKIAELYSASFDFEIPSGSLDSTTVLLKDQLIFASSVEAPSGNGELWSTDGTPIGTRLVKEIRPGSSPSLPSLIGQGENRAFFTADDGTHGRELWESDGTDQGTRLVDDLIPGPGWTNVYEAVALNDLAIYSSDEGLLAKPLETRARSRLLLGPSARPTILGAGSHEVFFVPFSEAYGFELWVTDGSVGGSTLVRDIRPGPESSLRSPFLVGRRELFILADDGVHGVELWRSDGTPEGTVLVHDVWPGSLGSFPREMTMIGDELWFAANDGAHGHEIWRASATGSGAWLVADIRPGRESSNPRAFHLLPSGKVVFIASDGEHGNELWVSDGTSKGTTMLEDVVPGPQGGVMSGFAHVGPNLFFGGFDSEAGAELWSIPLLRSRK